MAKMTDNTTSYDVNINPQTNNNNITLLTRNKCVTKDLNISYSIPLNNNTEKTIQISPWLYRNTTSFYTGDTNFKIWYLDCANIKDTFNASIELPLYKWYNNDYTIRYNVNNLNNNQIGFFSDYSLHHANLYAGENILYEVIQSGTTKASEYQGCQVYYTSSQESSYVYLGTIASNAKGTFNIDGDHLYNPSSFIAGRETFLTATNVSFSVYEANRGPNASYPSIPTFYIKTSSYAIDTDVFNDWDDIGIYIIPAYQGADGNSKCYLTLRNKSTGGGYYNNTEHELYLTHSIILAPNPNSSSSNDKWLYYLSPEGNHGICTCSGFRIRWNNANICRHAFKFIA